MKLHLLAAYFSLLLVSACTGVPEGLKPVEGFELQRYLGQWYEIARLDHSFERGLTDVSATYSLREDGGINVLNRGFDPKRGLWNEAKGRAYFLGSPQTASLKVSFFGPFYGGYHVIALDRVAYRYALISGPSRGYLWILARDKQLPEATLKSLVSQARQAGFATQNLIYVEHSR
jgi:apolipoprotein D and lipocalin family protein